MSLFKALRARLRTLARSRAERELGEEIRFHIDLEAEKNERLGMSPEEARRVAIAHFGGVQRVREEHRDVRNFQWLEDFVGDARFALRSLRRAPALAGAAIVTLALGIGANVAIFSAVNAVVLQPLPFASPDRLMVIGEDNPEKRWQMNVAAPANYLDWRAGVSDFADVMAYVDGLGTTVLRSRDREPAVLNTSHVTGNFFATLGVRATLGRVFTDEETWSSGNYVTVISDRMWRNQLGADPSIVGKTVNLGGRDVQVVGVMPPGFAFPGETVDLWRPVGFAREDVATVGFRRAHWLRVVARLKDGATAEHANAQLQSVVNRLKVEYPATNKFMGATMVPMHQFLVGDTRLPLLVLLTSVALLLLIACANVGNLLLVQAAGRTREASLRLALGAGRGRLVRQALAESVVLSVLGGAAGLALGWMGTRWLVRLQPADMLRVRDFGVDGAVIAYVVLITVSSAMVFGIIPALWMRHRSPALSLREGGRGAMQARSARRWANTLVAGEVALALLMSVGAGLLVRSLLQLQRADLGFDPRGVLAIQIGLGRAYDTPPKVIAFNNQLVERARGIPGVKSVGMVARLPMKGGAWTSDYIAEGRPADGYGTEVTHQVVSPDYFTTMKLAVLRGQPFTANETNPATPVVLINEALAKSYFAGQDPVGQRIAFAKVPTAQTTWSTIVGVVGNERLNGIAAGAVPAVYESLIQQPYSNFFLLLKTDSDPAALTASVRALTRELDPTLALYSVQTMESVRSGSLARAVFLTTLLLIFAGIGLVLSVVGVYGVLAHVARNRTREMGIRMALGARAEQVRWLVIRQGLGLTTAGLAGGALVALFATRAMTKLLFNVAPNDPITLVGVAGMLAATGVLASWIPAVKASRADPSAALRED